MSKAKKFVIITTIVWFIIPIYILFFYENILSQHCGASGIYGILFSIYSTIIIGGDLILMIIFSLLAVYNIRKGHLRIQPIISQRNHINRVKKRDLQLIKMLFGEVIVYVLTSIMFPIFIIYFIASINMTKTSYGLAIENFLIPDFFSYD